MKLFPIWLPFVNCTPSWHIYKCKLEKSLYRLFFWETYSSFHSRMLCQKFNSYIWRALLCPNEPPPPSNNLLRPPQVENSQLHPHSTRTRRSPWTPHITPRSATKSLRRPDRLPTRSPLSKSSRRWRRYEYWWSYTDPRPTRYASPVKSGNGLSSFYAGRLCVRLSAPHSLGIR